MTWDCSPLLHFQTHALFALVALVALVAHLTIPVSLLHHPLSHLHRQSYYGSPAELKDLNILELESQIMTAERRKHLPFLGHLALGTTFTFVEVDMTSIVSPGTMTEFAGEIKARDKARIKERASAKVRVCAAIWVGGQFCPVSLLDLQLQLTLSLLSPLSSLLSLPLITFIDCQSSRPAPRGQAKAAAAGRYFGRSE